VTRSVASGGEAQIIARVLRTRPARPLGILGFHGSLLAPIWSILAMLSNNRRNAERLSG